MGKQNAQSNHENDRKNSVIKSRIKVIFDDVILSETEPPKDSQKGNKPKSKFSKKLSSIDLHQAQGLESNTGTDQKRKTMKDAKFQMKVNCESINEVAKNSRKGEPSITKKSTNEQTTDDFDPIESIESVSDRESDYLSESSQNFSTKDLHLKHTTNKEEAGLPNQNINFLSPFAVFQENDKSSKKLSSFKGSAIDKKRKSKILKKKKNTSSIAAETKDSASSHGDIKSVKKKLNKAKRLIMSLSPNKAKKKLA